jgi:organic radical activating enzyme
MTTNRDKENFLYPHNSYRGEIRPENLVFNSNLQEFAQRVSYICNLETNGKLPPNTAYKQIKALWKELKQSKKQLGIGDNIFKKDDLDGDNSDA